MKKSHFEQMADATRPDFVKKPELTKEMVSLSKIEITNLIDDAVNRAFDYSVDKNEFVKDHLFGLKHAPEQPEPTKRFSVDVIFNDNHTNIITDMQNVTDREVEDIIEGIQDQWEFQNKPKPSTKGYRDLDDLADSLGNSIDKLNAMIKNRQP